MSNFPEYHNPQARQLYIIWLAVSPNFRRRGIGSQLVRALQELVKTEQLDKIQLASRDELISFYQQLEFQVYRPLGHFLPDTTYTLMVWSRGNL